MLLGVVGGSFGAVAGGAAGDAAVVFITSEVEVVLPVAEPVPVVELSGARADATAELIEPQSAASSIDGSESEAVEAVEAVEL